MSKIASEVNSIYNQVRAIVEEIEQYEKPLWIHLAFYGDL